MRNQKARVIIDTNLWISFLLTKDFTKFDTIIADKKLVLLFSQELIEEIVDPLLVLSEGKVRLLHQQNEISKLLLLKLKSFVNDQLQCGNNGGIAGENTSHGDKAFMLRE